MWESHREVEELKVFKRLQMIWCRFNSRYICDYLALRLERILHSLNEEYSEDTRKYLNPMKGKLRIRKFAVVAICSIHHHGQDYEKKRQVRDC